MTKRLQITLLSVLAALLCFTLVFGCVSLAPKSYAATTSEDGTTVTFDKEEDFVVNSSKRISELSAASKALLTENVTHVNIIVPDGITAILPNFFKNNLYKDFTVSLRLSKTVTMLAANNVMAPVHFDSIKIDPENTTYSDGGKNCIIGITQEGSLGQYYQQLILSGTGEIPDDPDLVTGICSYALHGVTSAHIPANITEISSTAFNSALETLTVDEGNTVYTDGGVNALITKENNKLVMATKGTTGIPDTVKIIGANAFDSKGVTEIVIPNSVEQIEANAFIGCVGLQKLSVPFVGMTKNSGTFENVFGRSSGSEYVAVDTFFYVPTSLTEINITGSGLVLREKALYPGYGISSYGFNKATNLTKLTVPDDVTFDGSNVIDPEAHFFVEDENGNKYLGNDTNEKVILVSVANKTNLTEIIPEGVRVINENAYQNAKMVEVVLPSTLKQICANAFDGCTDIVSVYNLSSLDIQKGSEEHGKVALYANSVYTEFNGSKIDSTTIEGYTFIADDIPVLYRYTGSDTNITLPANYNGKRYNIADNAFNGNNTVTDVVIPTLSALNIGESAFEGCTSLKSIVINDLENSIGKAAFKGCTSLTSITFYNCHITEIADQAFMNCSSLLEIAVPETVTTIGTSAFEECTSAVAITLGNKVEYIGGKAFANTASLKTATIPDSVTEFGYGGGEILVGNPWKRDYVFAGSGIESVYIGSGLQYMGNTFADCVNLKEISFSQNSSLKNISYAFVNCTALTTLTIPEGVIKAQYALNGVTNLTSLYIPYSLVNVTSTASADLTTRYSDMSLRSTESPYPEYAHLTMYLPDLPKDATAEEIDAFARKLAVFAVYSDYSSIDTYVMGNSQFNVNTVFANQVTVLSKEAYDAVHKVLSDTTDGNLYSTFTTFGRYFSNYDGLRREDIISHFYYVADVTYELYKQMSDGDIVLIDTQTVQKLANNEGADIRYVLMTDKYGSKYYAIDESYAMPTIIGATKANGEWKVGSADGEAFVLDGAKINGASKFVNVLGVDAKLEITVDDEYTATYNGEEWTLPASLADKATITEITLNNKTVTEIKDAGIYTVVLTAGSDYVFANGETTTTITVTINKAQATVVWTYKGEVLTENEVVTKPFDGKSIASELTLTYVGADKQQVTISNDLLRRLLNGTGSTANAMGAGLWTLYLDELAYANDHPNYVFAHASHQFRINNVQLSSNDVLDGVSIDLEGTATLNDGMLYIYEDNSHNIIPSRTPLTGYTLKEVINVERSIIRYTNRDWTLNAVVNSDNADKLALNADGTEHNVQKAIGKQTTTFVLNAKDNYEFALSINGSVAERGLTFTVSDDGKTLTVTKTWYVVQLANELVKADYTGTDEPADSDLYTVANWTYGQNVSFTLPRLWHGDEGANWATDDSHVKFTLTMQGVADAIVSNANRSVLLNYLNKYMPAGSYTLVVTVSAFDGVDASYPTFSRIYDFTVAKAAITIDESKLPKNDNTGYANYAWELTDNANKQLFFKDFADKITANGVLNTVVMTDTVNNNNYWMNEGKTYFGDYEVKYNFARMNNEVYVLSNNNDILTLIDGGARGTYTVYFQVEMKNHENLTNIGNDGRYAYFFTVTVWEKVATPVVSSDGLVYTGNKVIPEIAESELYEVIWSSTDGYVAGGQHSVSFKLHDSVHYRWANSQTDTVSVNFTIAKADNVFTVALNMLGWNYETFDAAVNNIRATARYLDDGQSIHFRVVKKGETTAVTGLADFTIDANGKVNATVAQALNALKVGEYTLYAKVNATDNYNELERNVSFAVAKSINTWADGEDDLVLPSWIVGTFNPEENLIVVKAAHGEAIIEIRDMDGNVYYNSTKPEENTLNTLDVGKYLLVAWVEESEDFAALAERSFTIEVLEKIGLPWWGTTLIAVGALAVAAAIILILWKLKVFEILTDKISLAITTRATVDATIAAVRATKKAEEAEAHKRKVEARERLEAAREANKNKTPEQRAEELAAKAEVTATKADKLHARASKMRERADKLAGKTEQTADVMDEVTENPDDTSTEE